MNLADATSNAVRQIVSEAAAAAPRGATVFQAQVTNVLSGTAADGNALVQVSWRGSKFTAAYLSTYAPAIGHQVAVVLAGSEPLILGRVIGTPSA